ncbi:MAG: M12 family metallo-peptidase [Candidatus Thalassarchaeum betae]|nr:M12 family metallo-peptidase [Candidatus Thalassoarchaea betae]
MRICAPAVVLILCSAIFSGCFGTIGGLERNCDEQEYWMDIGEEYPYPGMQCDSGPTRVLSLTIFVYKDNDGVDYISDEESIAQGIVLINSVYSQHGITFSLGEIVWVDEAFPDAGEDSDGDYGEMVPIDALGSGFTEGYNHSGVNVVLVTDGWGAYSMYPFSTKEFYVTYARASTFTESYVPAHELGHFLGLYHTHHNSDNPNSDSDLGSALSWTQDWVVPADQCYRTGDFICGTPYDCYNFCEEAIGCSASDLYEEEKPGQDSGVEQCSAEEHSPSLTNLMSRYGDRSELTDDQGARARYFVQFMIENDRMGNQLVLVK